MTVIVFAQPYVKPLPPDQLAGWERFGLIWHGWDGSTWDLRDVRSGIFVTNEGLLGLDDPQFVPETYESPATSGRWRTDYRVPQRPFEIPVYISNDDGSPEWLAAMRAFRRSFHPLKPGTLELRTPLGTRTIELFLDGDGDFSYTRDALFEGRSRYRIKTTAEDPFWKGEVWSARYENVSPDPFFGADGNLHVASSATLATAEVENDGDEDAWLRLELEAGASNITATITIAGGTLGPPMIPAGQVLEIDTDPAVGSADLNGVEVDGLVDPWDPRPIPAGETTQLGVSLSGFGAVTVFRQSRYWRGL